MSVWSFAATLDVLDTFPQHDVMQRIADAYEKGTRGLFSEKFISMMDMQMLGYEGFKRMLQSLYEINPRFVEDNKMELIELVRALSKAKEMQDHG